MDNNWNKSLKEKMAGYSEVEPEGLLQEIFKEIDNLPENQKLHHVHTGSGKSFFRKTLLIPIIGVAASLSVFFLMRHSLNNDTSNTIAETSSAKKHTSEITEEIRIIETDKNMLTADSRYGTKQHQFHDYQNIQHTKNLNHDNNGRQDTIEVASQQNDFSEDTDKQNSSTLISSDPIERINKKYGSFEEKDTDNFDDSIKREKHKRFSTDIFYSNLTGSRSNFNGYSTMRQGDTEKFSGIPVREFISGAPGEGAMLLAASENSNTEIMHRQPVRTGISFRYNFNRRWGIETGISYTLLFSRLKSSESKFSSSTDQRLHYLGIPVEANWSFIDRKHFTMYINAGGMVEKCIAGKAVTEYAFEGKGVTSSQEKVMTKHLQWSVTAGAGVQWRITSLIGIYAEPGVSYHFNDRSPINTIYKERPLNFNIEFGLRFTFE